MAVQRRTSSRVSAQRRGRRRPTFIVGIGGSAGGLEALEQFFSGTARDTGLAFVLVTHLDPHHKALLPELIQRTTEMPVRETVDGARVAANTVYVIPPNRDLTIEGDQLRTRPPSSRSGPRTPIDRFFRSLAQEWRSHAIGVVLSGMGSDGAPGLRAIKEAGGLTLVQDPASAAFDSMPLAALDAVAVDAVGSPDQLPTRIAELVGGSRPGPAAKQATEPAPSAGLVRVLDIVHQRTGHDLSLYKRTSIERRLERRLAVHRLTTFDAYADYLDANPEEVELAFRELLIGVTHFFRDEDAFLVLRDRALPHLLAARRPPRSLRAWVAGCSSGEEAYSLAIVIREVLETVGAHDVSVQIYATDIDAGAIGTARAGRYSGNIANHVSPERLARHFVREDDGYRIRKEIRDTLVFAQHDLITDPPFTRMDVLCCRNVLIYLQPELQQELLPRFHYALNSGGLLVLGVSESVASAEKLFTPVDSKAKVFRSLDAGRGGRRRDMPVAPRSGFAGAPPGGDEPTMVEAARRAIVESLAPPTVVINERGDILYSSRRTGRYLEPAVGKANINIFAMARDGLGPHLSLAVRQALGRRRRVTCAGVVVRGDRGQSRVDLHVIPMSEPASLRGLLLVVFEASPPEPTTKAKGASGRAPIDKVSSRTAMGRELTRTRLQLRSVVRDMEASQAQVAATNEELQSANEELQSTNEELTTSKEELQSLNEELLSLNAEFESKNDELATANDDLRNLLNSSRIPTLFLDNELRIKRFTSEATHIANLIPGDVGRLITDITLAIRYDHLKRDVAEVLDTLIFKEVQVTGADGASYTMRIHPYRTMDNRIDGVVITFSDVTALRRAEQALSARAHEGVVTRLLDRWPGMVYVRDLALRRDVYVNELARQWLTASGSEDFESLLHPDDAAANGGSLERLAMLRDGEVITRHVRLRGRGGSYASFRHRESVLARSATGAPTRVLTVIEDAHFLDHDAGTS
jgi:two-component system CheB/CheR fusion protein